MIFGSLIKKLKNFLIFSRCSISSLFRIYLYNSTLKNPSALSLYEEFKTNPARTNLTKEACIFVIIIDNFDQLNLLKNLNYWNFGRNCLVIYFNEKPIQTDVLQSAMLVSEHFEKGYCLTLKKL